MMETPHSEWADRMSAYLDGDLPPRMREALEEHVQGCAPCRVLLEDLRALVDAAGSLGDSEPSRDLWPEIAAAIRGEAAPAQGRSREDVIELFAAHHQAPRPAGVRFSIPQLAAASVVLAVTSAAITWWVGPGIAPREEGASLPVAESPTTFVADPGGPPPSLASELRELEQVLEDARGRLDPNTARILEKNLGVIERAIEESRRALAVDPENTFLRGHLDRAYQEKATYLREAASIAEWIG